MLSVYSVSVPVYYFCVWCIQCRFITLLSPIMLNYHLGFTPEKLFARGSQQMGLLHMIYTTLVTVLSLPNVARGMFLLVLCGVGGAYLARLWWEAKQQMFREKTKGNVGGSKRVVKMYAMKGHSQVTFDV